MEPHRRGRRKMWESKGSRTPWEHSPQNQLSRAHKVSQRLKWKQRPRMTELGPLHIPNGCLAWWSAGSPNSGNEECLWLFCQHLRPLPSTGLLNPAFFMKAYSYWNLLGHILWISSWGLLYLFSPRVRREEWICEKTKMGEDTGRSRGRKKNCCNWDAMYEIIL